MQSTNSLQAKESAVLDFLRGLLAMQQPMSDAAMGAAGGEMAANQVGPMQSVMAMGRAGLDNWMAQATGRAPSTPSARPMPMADMPQLPAMPSPQMAAPGQRRMQIAQALPGYMQQRTPRGLLDL